MKIGERIREYRHSRAMSQDALAKRIGVTRAVVTAWESGRACPRSDKIKPLAEALRCRVQDLVC